MRTFLTVATGFVLVAGLVVGVTTAQASSGEALPIQPIRVEAPAESSAVVPELPADAAAQQAAAQEAAAQQAAQDQAVQQAPPQQGAPQEAAPRREAPRDPNGYVAPPPADDDGDDDGDDDSDDGGGDDADDD